MSDNKVKDVNRFVDFFFFFFKAWMKSAALRTQIKLFM